MFKTAVAAAVVAVLGLSAASAFRLADKLNAPAAPVPAKAPAAPQPQAPPGGPVPDFKNGRFWAICCAASTGGGAPPPAGSPPGTPSTPPQRVMVGASYDSSLGPLAGDVTVLAKGFSDSISAWYYAQSRCWQSPLPGRR